LIPTLGWSAHWAWGKYVQQREEWESFLNCESDYLWVTKGTIEYRSKNLQRQIRVEELKAIRESIGTREPRHLICPHSQLPYEWSDENVDLTGHGIVVWDPRPHGTAKQFRNIVTTNGDMKRMGEPDFQSIYRASVEQK